MKIDKIVASILEAAVDPSRWTDALEAVSKATGSFGAIILPVPGAGSGGIPRTASMEESFEVYVRDGWIGRDLRYRSAPLIHSRRVVTDLDLISEDQLARSPYYQEFLAPHGLRWFAGVGIACGEARFVLSLQRTIEQGPFSPEQVELLKDLSGRLEAAAAIIVALSGARAEAALAAFELSGAAVVLLDGFGKVIRLNNSAEALLSGDLDIRHGYLTSSSPRATTKLDKLLHVLLNSEQSVALQLPVSLPREGKRPILAYPARLPRMMDNFLGPARGLIVLIDLELQPRAPGAALRAIFGLTETESKLAAKLASGVPIQVCAEEFRMTYETARKHLKAIFAKTDTHRQAELVALVGQLPPVDAG